LRVVLQGGSGKSVLGCGAPFVGVFVRQAREHRQLDVAGANRHSSTCRHVKEYE